MSNSTKSRVGAGAAARKRDRYTSRMNEVHPPRLGREAMDAKYLIDPLYERVMSLSHHLSEHYGDYTVNEIRTLVNMAASNPDHPMLQKYWDEIGGAVSAGSSDTDSKSVSDDGSGPSSDFSAPLQDECSPVELKESAGQYDRIAGSDACEVALNQTSEQEGSVPLLVPAEGDESISEPPAVEGDLFTLEMARHAVAAMQLEDVIVVSKTIELDVNQGNVSTFPKPPPRRNRHRAVESVELDLFDVSAVKSAAVWSCVMDPVHITPPVDGSLSKSAPSRDVVMPGRKRICAEVRPMPQGYCGALSSFLDRETRCSQRGLRAAVCIAGLVLACVCGVSASM